MVIDYSKLLYDPVYAEVSVPATLTLADTDGTEASITVYDQTRKKTLPAGSAEVHGVGPGAFARVPELTANGITCADCRGAVLTFNGQSWLIRNFEKQGSPNGEDLGEVLFLLKAIGSSDD